MLENYVPLPTYFAINRLLLSMVVIGYIVFFPVLLKFKLNTPFRFVLLIMAIPMCCWVNIVLVNSPERILHSAQLGDSHHYLTGRGSIGDWWVVFYTYKCNSNDLECKEKFIGHGASFGQANMVVDTESNELYVLTQNVVEYSYGSFHRSYNFLYNEELAGYTYWVAQNNDSGLAEFVIYRCSDEIAVKCTQIPFAYSTENYSFAELVGDEENQEVSLLIDERLIYTYGTESQCHVDGCIIPNK